MTSPGLKLFLKLRTDAARGYVDLSDVRKVVAGFEAILRGLSWEAAYDLSSAFRIEGRMEFRAQVDLDQLPKSSARQAAAKLKSDLCRYLRADFAHDEAALIKPEPDSYRGTLYTLALSFNGKEPGLRTLQRMFEVSDKEERLRQLPPLPLA